MAELILVAGANALAPGLLGSAGLAAGTFGAALGGSVITGIAGIAGSYIDSALFGPSRDTEGPRLSSLSPPTATEGAFLREVIGTMRVPGELIWTLTKEEVKKTQKAGKGGGGTAATFSYFGTFGLAFCGGVATIPQDIYVNSELVAASDLPMTFYPGNRAQMPDPVIVAAQGAAPAYRGIAYAVFDRMPLDEYGGAYPLIESVVTVPPPSPGLRGIVAQLAANRDLVIDTSGVDENTAITGYVVDSMASFRGAVAPLSALFDLDISEVAGEVRVVSRRHVPLVELEEAALIAQDGAPVIWRRGAGADVPRETVMKSYAPERGFSVRTTAPIKRADATGERQKVIDFPGALDPDSRATLHRSAVVRMEDARESVSFSARLATLVRTPGDILTVPSSSSRRHDALIMRQVIGASIRYEGAVISSRPALASGTAPQAFDQRFRSGATSTVILFMDLPALTDSEADAHAPWVAMDGTLWRGGIVWRDEGQGYLPIVTVTDRAAIGALVTALPAGIAGAQDSANTVQVRMRGDHVFESIPYGDLSDTTLNAVAIRNNVGDWEVLQFSTATLTGPSLWTLTGLRRGLRGTEFAMGALSGAPVVVLDDAIRKLPLEREQLGILFPYRHGPIGAASDDVRVSQLSRAFGGAGLRPVSPTEIEVEYTAASDAVISWTPRRRLSTDPSTLPDRHRVRVYDGAAVQREWTAEAPVTSQAYPEADMLADHGGTAPISLDIGIMPVTDEYGDGAEARVVIPI